MTEIGYLLRDDDPVAREGALTQADADAIRRVVVAAGRRTAHAPAFWPRPLWVAATIVLTLSAGIVAGRRLAAPDPVRDVRAIDPVAVPTALAAGDRRQVHFATPGGTRIIWVLNPEFNP